MMVDRSRTMGGGGGGGHGGQGWTQRKVLAVAVVGILLLGGAAYFSLGPFFKSGAATPAAVQTGRIDTNLSTACKALAASGKPCTASNLKVQADREDANAYNACLAAAATNATLKARCLPSVSSGAPPPTTTPPTTTPPTSTPPSSAPPTTAAPTGTFPNASNTGVPAGTVLKAYTGPWTITAANTALTGVDFTGSNRLTISAPGVTIKNSKFENNDDNGFLVSMDDSNPAATVTISDSEFVGAGASFDYDQMAIRGNGWNLLRVNGHNLENLGGDDSNDTVKDSYFHNYPTTNPGCDHFDGFQSLGQVDNVTIQHNTIIMDTSDCISAPIQLGTEYGYGGKNFLIDDNLLAGGAHVIYCGDGAQTDTGATVTDTNVRVTNNHFSKQIFPTYGAYSVSDHCATGKGVTWTGNVDADSGAVVPPNG